VGKTREVTPPPAAAAPPVWRPLAGLPPLTPPVLAEILDGGQAFRWTAGDSAAGPVSSWIGQWADHRVPVRLAPDGRLEWQATDTNAATTGAALAAYFAVDRDFTALADSLPWRSDLHLARCLATFPGLRLLRQPFGETLLGFLCSATKQIVQIKQMLALLAARHGQPITGAPPPGPTPHRLPTWPELARISEAELRACQLGFRARYIADTARFLAAHPGWLEETEHLAYAEAKARLCALPGVGAKIADCVLLFGAGRLEAFPVDTWILKALAHHYGLAGWTPAQVAHFGRVHFGPLAGLAQQYLFAWERRESRAALTTASGPAG
jgi:N-glycosylase/DNA lyase